MSCIFLFAQLYIFTFFLILGVSRDSADIDAPCTHLKVSSKKFHHLTGKTIFFHIIYMKYEIYMNVTLDISHCRILLTENEDAEMVRKSRQRVAQFAVTDGLKL